MLSHSRTAAPAAAAARQAGVCARPPSGPHAAARLNGLVGAPWALAGTAVSSSVAPTATSATNARRVPM